MDLKMMSKDELIELAQLAQLEIKNRRQYVFGFNFSSFNGKMLYCGPYQGLIFIGEQLHEVKMEGGVPVLGARVTSRVSKHQTWTISAEPSQT
jgi:hypothetical protein